MGKKERAMSPFVLFSAKIARRSLWDQFDDILMFSSLLGSSELA